MALSTEAAPMDNGCDDDEAAGALLLTDCQLPEHFAKLAKLRREGVFCDTQVSVAGRDFQAHRCVLGAAAPYFLRLLLGEPNCAHFTLPPACSPDAFAALLDYCYTGRLLVPEGLLPAVCSLACLLGVRPVLEACAGRLLATLVPHSVLAVRAQLVDCPQLLEQIDAYVTLNLAKVLSRESASLPKIIVDVLVVGGANPLTVGVGIHAVCELLADWLARSLREAPTASSSSSSPPPVAAVNGGDSWRQLEAGVAAGDGEQTVDLDCLERMASQSHLLYLTPGYALVDCDDLAAVNGGESDLANLVPQIRDYIDSKRLHSRVVTSRHRGPSPLPRAVLGVLTAGSASGAADPDADPPTILCLARVSTALALLSVRLLPLPEEAERAKPGEPERVRRQSSAQSSVASGDGIGGDTGVAAAGFSSASSGCQADAPSAAPVCMSTPRSAFGLVEMSDGSLLACGGYNRGQCLSSAEVLRPALSHAWAPAPPLLAARSRCSAAALGGCVYVCGGSDGNCELATVEVFDGTQWLAGPAMQQARSGCSAVAMDGVLYCLGGRNGAASLRHAELLDPRVGRWRSLAPMLASRNECAAAGHAGCVWVAGGADSWGGQCLATVEAYEPRAGRWLLTTHQLGHPRRGAAMAELAGRLWLVGGSDGHQPALAACEPVLTSVVAPDGADVDSGLGGQERRFDASPTPTLQLASARANLGLAALPGGYAGCGAPCMLAAGGFSGKVFLDCCELLLL